MHENTEVKEENQNPGILEPAISTFCEGVENDKDSSPIDQTALGQTIQERGDLRNSHVLSTDR